MNLDDIRTTAQDFNMRNDWDTRAAIALAREVLSDCNLHSLALKFDQLEREETAYRNLLDSKR